MKYGVAGVLCLIAASIGALFILVTALSNPALTHTQVFLKTFPVGLASAGLAVVATILLKHYEDE